MPRKSEQERNSGKKERRKQRQEEETKKTEEEEKRKADTRAAGVANYLVNQEKYHAEHKTPKQILYDKLDKAHHQWLWVNTLGGKVHVPYGTIVFDILKHIQRAIVDNNSLLYEQVFHINHKIESSGSSAAGIVKISVMNTKKQELRLCPDGSWFWQGFQAWFRVCDYDYIIKYDDTNKTVFLEVRFPRTVMDDDSSLHKIYQLYGVCYFPSVIDEQERAKWLWKNNKNTNIRSLEATELVDLICIHNFFVQTRPSLHNDCYPLDRTKVGEFTYSYLTNYPLVIQFDEWGDILDWDITFGLRKYIWRKYSGLTMIQHFPPISTQRGNVIQQPAASFTLVGTFNLFRDGFKEVHEPFSDEFEDYNDERNWKRWQKCKRDTNLYSANMVDLDWV